MYQTLVVCDQCGEIIKTTQDNVTGIMPHHIHIYTSHIPTPHGDHEIEEVDFCSIDCMSRYFRVIWRDKWEEYVNKKHEEMMGETQAA